MVVLHIVACLFVKRWNGRCWVKLFISELSYCWNLRKTCFRNLVLNFGDEILLRGGGYSDPGLFSLDYCIRT